MDQPGATPSCSSTLLKLSCFINVSSFTGAPSPKSPNNRSESSEQTPTSKIEENLVNLFSINIVNWMGSDFRKKIICSLLGLGQIRKRKPVINQEGAMVLCLQRNYVPKGAKVGPGYMIVCKCCGKEGGHGDDDENWHNTEDCPKERVRWVLFPWQEEHNEHKSEDCPKKEAA
ncbi:unnamed protein product [Prunus armeniaca]|uniref:Uncharacterized protein n=1 Tax=Prunus armeniaca TaxID=36596 RepID=A0A6J5VD50_PRUAR|nr:unnamed protein product [Prunus armeniaca]